MNLRIVVDGESRLRESVEFRRRLAELRASIRAGHAEEFAKAGFLRRLVLRIRMAFEYRHERKRIEPSPYSLFACR